MPTLLPRPGHVFVQTAGGSGGGDGESVGEAGNASDLREVFHRIKARLPDNQRQDGDGVIVREKECQSVRPGVLEQLRGNLPARAGAVIHNHRLTQLDSELVGQQARDGIGAAAGRKADQDMHGLAARDGRAGHGRRLSGKFGSPCGWKQGGGQRAGGEAFDEIAAFHGWLVGKCGLSCKVSSGGRRSISASRSAKARAAAAMRACPSPAVAARALPAAPLG